MNIPHRCIALLLGLAVVPAVGDVLATEYVVAPTGDDADAGNRKAPLRTIQRAATLMRHGDTCLIRGGDYFETVKPAADGTPDAPIVFRAWPGETPTLWGTEPITDWKPHADGTYRAPMDWSLGKNNQLFVDGKMIDEARWPDTKDDDLLTPEGARITKGGDDFIQCDELPDGLADDHFKGAVLWVLAGAKWTSWSTVVDAYDARTKTLRFPKIDHGSIGRNMNPGDRRGGHFYLVGKREMLNAPAEWCYDDAEKMLYLRAPENADPRTLHVTAKRRMVAFDLSGKSHVHLVGVDVVGATIDMRECEHCLVEDVRIRYLSHTRGGRTDYNLNEPTGIRITGHDNVIRDSEIAYSAGSGIYLDGRSNAVINCWIHDIDYMGSYGCPVKTSGTAHLISHNTIHDTGRDCIQPGGQAHLIQYNDIFRMGRICHDLGATYVCGSDGGGTEFRYNWSHDNVAGGTRMGIYLDNFTSNYFVHHNVCWNTRGDEIRLNKPSLYNIVAHNTMLGYSGNWGRWPTDWMYGCVYANNLLSSEIRPHPQPTLVGNVQNVPKDVLHAGNFQTTVAGVDRGIVLPGITGPFEGKAPDAGAYEQGMPAWRAGHDFNHRPRPIYEPTDTPLRNRILHGSFDWIQYRGQLGPWRGTHAKAAVIQRGPGGISQSYTTRNTIIGAGVQLQGPQSDGIEQTVEGLQPNTTYELAGWLKLGDAAEVRLGIRGHGAEQKVASVTSHEWTQPRVRFTTGPTATSAIVFLTKQGPGTAHADDLGLVPVLENFPLGKPGMVQPIATE